ncbi:hypothetical protein F5B19DRAFT_401609 [Rostrohypoxylon terebratum]|nr:hypothetical protein F5B19DRAFT_401609 [Rostrohypoxylon terebratum]
MSENDDLASLRKAYIDGHSQTSLNPTFREALKDFCRAQSLQLSEDSAGNNYITRPGKFTGIPPIAIAFPLDDSAELQFTSTFRLFLHLSKVQLPCDVMLVGWSSLGLREVGRDIWSTINTKPNPTIPPELEPFQQRDSPKNFSVSAVFVVAKLEAPLTISGSPVLMEKVRSLTTDQAYLSESVGDLIRAPNITILGHEAESIACALIKEYGAHVVALFDNFD